MAEIKNVSEFIKELIALTTMESSGSTSIYWFRGESDMNCDTKLIPSGYRDLSIKIKEVDNKRLASTNEIKKEEANIDSIFLRKSFKYLRNIKVKNTLANRYFIMQHYGLTTRLLDWSENALIALYFACSDNHNTQKSNGQVYILNPISLNDKTFKNILDPAKSYPHIPSLSNNLKKKKLRTKDGKIRMSEITRRFLKMDFLYDDSPSGKSYFPLAIYPPYLEDRIQSQSACFTIFGNEIEGLYNIEDTTILSSITISHSYKKKILRELTVLGISESTVYPGLDGVGKSLKQDSTASYLQELYSLEHIIVNNFNGKKE